MIDYDFEARLVDRIAVREAIAAADLTPRLRRILCRYARYGDTYNEIANRECLSVERVRQLHFKAIRKVKARVVQADRPLPTGRRTPPPGFDGAEFLRHMRLLIELREKRILWEREEQERREREELARLAGLEQREFERERTALAKLIASEEAKHKPPPPLTFKPPPPSHIVWNSPSYTPPPRPTEGALRAKAEDALQYFLAKRQRTRLGRPWLGTLASRVVFPLDGGRIDIAMDHLIAEIPPDADLSAMPLAVDKGMLAATAATPYCALRVSVAPDGLNMFIDVTWDRT